MLNVLHVVQPLCVPPEAQFALNGNGQVQETRCTKKQNKKKQNKKKNTKQNYVQLLSANQITL